MKNKFEFFFVVQIQCYHTHARTTTSNKYLKKKVEQQTNLVYRNEKKVYRIKQQRNPRRPFKFVIHTNKPKKDEKLRAETK